MLFVLRTAARKRSRRLAKGQRLSHIPSVSLATSHGYATYALPLRSTPRRTLILHHDVECRARRSYTRTRFCLCATRPVWVGVPYVPGCDVPTATFTCCRSHPRVVAGRHETTQKAHVLPAADGQVARRVWLVVFTPWSNRFTSTATRLRQPLR